MKSLKTTLSASILWAAASMALPAQTFTTLQSFDNTNGANPFPALVQSTNGDLYGTTYGGGANLGGSIFKITLGGALSTVYSFCSQSNCTDGSLPRGALMQDSNGNLYGTTLGGGVNNRGTVYKITPAGSLTTLYSFCNLVSCADGSQPYAGLVQASNGDLYGTTPAGGEYGFGTIFAITPAGALTTLYSFCATSGCPDGGSPAAGLIQASNGDFYGTTQEGGANSNPGCGANNCGTVFRFSGGGGLTTLYSFCAKSACADGYNPTAPLLLASNGNFYGTTFQGGANNNNNGTVFEMTPAGKLKTLLSFCAAGNCMDGQGPLAGLIQATDGNLYGTTTAGGIGYGTIFQITLTGAFKTLFELNDPDGAGPDAGLVQATNGTFYGTTFFDGAYGDGSVYSLSIGLGAFIETLPASGKVGTPVKILGTDLTGATSVTFNRQAAAFKVVSSTEITTAVPGGATSGVVQVTTPGGTFSSNVSFRVP